MKYPVFVCFFLLLIVNTSARAQSVLAPNDGVIPDLKNRQATTRKPIPYAPLREADVMWKKRVWRIIDLREKINLPLYYPIQGDVNGLRSLANVLYTAAVEEVSLRVYADFPDDFSIEITASEVKAKVSKRDSFAMKSMLDPSLDSINIDGSLYYQPFVEEFQSNRVKKILLKEEWFFDRQRSMLDVRILGICPLYEQEDKEKGDKYLFWVYFPDARATLAQYDVFNRVNGSERRTFDDIFWKRQFSSYIIKEENVYDRAINEYKKGLDALLESNRIKDEIVIFEHDLWEF